MTFKDFVLIFFIFVALLIIVYVIIALIRTVLFKNPYIKIIKKPTLSSGKINEYQKSMSYLMGNRLDKALLDLFPNAMKYGKLVYFRTGLMYVYRNNEIDALSMLIDIPIYSTEPNETNMGPQCVEGENTYHSKAEVYAVMDSIESILIANKQMKLNIKILMYDRSKTNQEMISYLFEKGEQFDIALGEGGKVLDPLSTNLKSFYSFVGVGINEKVKYRFSTQRDQKGNLRLASFIGDMLYSNHFEMKFDNELEKYIIYAGRDMTYGNRFILNNIRLLRKTALKLVDEEMDYVSSAWKTHFVFDEVYYDDNTCYVDCEFYVSNNSSTKEVDEVINKYLLKHGIEKTCLFVEEKTKITSTRNKTYRRFIKVVENAVSEAYISPYIINKDVSDRDIDKVGKCVVRFSPFYYPGEKINENKVFDKVYYTSIDRAVTFYEELFKEFSKYEGKFIKE